MNAYNVQTQPKPKMVVGPKNAPAREEAGMPDAVQTQDMIRDRAYQIYESRGHENGQHEQDWLRAEQEIVNRKNVKNLLPR